jgi:hypothetical protein
MREEGVDGQCSPSLSQKCSHEAHDTRLPVHECAICPLGDATIQSIDRREFKHDYNAMSAAALPACHGPGCSELRASATALQSASNVTSWQMTRSRLRSPAKSVGVTYVVTGFSMPAVQVAAHSVIVPTAVDADDDHE